MKTRKQGRTLALIVGAMNCPWLLVAVAVAAMPLALLTGLLYMRAIIGQ
jgi:hypothetical protein